MLKNYEIPFSTANFKAIQHLAVEHAGLVLTDHKHSMIYNRLIKRVRDELKLKSFDEYIHLLQTQPIELGFFINCITTNLTSFFRENHHFVFLQQVELPRILNSKSNLNKIRIWSAGCSTGEEPYSIAIVAREVLPEFVQLEIIATDIDSQVLSVANKAIYSQAQIANISRERLKFAFLQGSGANVGLVKIKPLVKQAVHFKQANLLESQLANGKFNIIFCRNVLIYFNQEKKKEIIKQFAAALAPAGLLILGHSESLYGLSEYFQSVGTTIYRKINTARR